MLVDNTSSFAGASCLGALNALGYHFLEKFLENGPLVRVLRGVYKLIDGLGLVLDGEENVIVSEEFSALARSSDLAKLSDASLGDRF